MKSYLVELYRPAGSDAGLAGAEEARAAAAALTDEWTEVRYLRSFFIPADETCFHLFEAASDEAIAEAARTRGPVALPPSDR